MLYDEMTQQYPAMERTLAHIEANFAPIRALFEDSRARKIVFLGCGSSFNIAESLALTTQMHLHRPAFAIPAGDLLLHVPDYAGFLEDCLVVALSRSGSTTEMLLAIKALKKRADTPVVSIICRTGSELARISDLNLEMPWAFDASVCQTRTVACLYLAGTQMLARLAKNEALLRDLRRVVELGPAYMHRTEAVFKQIAALPWDNAVVLGDAELAGIAGEGALAFKEICQLPSNYYHLLDARHGPFVMIREDSLVIVILSEPGNPLEAAVVNELVHKGATVLCYSDRPVTGLDEKATQVNFGEPLQHAARGIPFILIAQMTAYYKAISRGINPDAPAGLSAWIKL
jgi:glutamine---fructose-6-phosphate transaminase (isomerizing)